MSGRAYLSSTVRRFVDPRGRRTGGVAERGFSENARRAKRIETPHSYVVSDRRKNHEWRVIWSTYLTLTSKNHQFSSEPK